MAVANIPRPVATSRRRSMRVWLYVAAIAITLFMLLPIYLIVIAAFSPRAAISAFPKSWVPTQVSFDTMVFFMRSTGVARAAWNSIVVGVLTPVLALLRAHDGTR